MSGWKLILGSLVRNALQWAFGLLVAHSVLTANQAGSFPVTEMALGIVGGLSTLGWSLWQKAESKWKFLAALDAAPSTPQGQIDADSKFAPIAEKIAAIKE